MLSSLRSSHLAVLAAIALAAGSPPAFARQPAMTAAVPYRPKLWGIQSGYHGTTSPVGRRNAGISVAKGKRAARKARNVARNRRHHR